MNFAFRTSAQLDSLDDIFKILAQGANHYLQKGVGAGNGVGKWVGSDSGGSSSWSTGG